MVKSKNLVNNLSLLKKFSFNNLRKNRVPLLLIVIVIIYLMFRDNIHNFLGLSREGMSLLDNTGMNTSEMKEEKMELVYLYMNGCGHCKTFTPEFDKFASNYKGSCKVIKLERGESGAKKYLEENNVQGFPTVLLIKESETIEFQGERTEEGLLKFMEENSKKTS